MHGVHSRAEVVATATNPNRWRDLTMKDRQLLQSGDDFAIISYRAEVTRADGEPYMALVSSAYVRRSHGWKLAFRSEEHTSELQSLMRISYAVFCLKTKNKKNKNNDIFYTLLY